MQGNLPNSAQVSWWLDKIFLPGFFLFVGAVLGRAKDRLDERRGKKAFLIAIRAELSEVLKQLEGTLKDATSAKQALMEWHAKLLPQPLVTDTPYALILLPAFQTGIYSSQVGKLKVVRDPRVRRIIRFYDRLSNLERVKSRMTSVSFEVIRKGIQPKHEGDMALVQEYADALDEVVRRANQLLPEVKELISDLPES